MYMVASSAADIRDWKTPFSFVEQHIIFMNCINMTCWKCLYFSLISRGRLSSRFWWNINISCGSLISYGVDKIRNSEKENKKNWEMFCFDDKRTQSHHRTASWQRGRRTTRLHFRYFSRLPKNRYHRNKFTGKGKKAELHSHFFQSFRPRLVHLIVRWEPPEPHQTSSH